MIPIYSVDNQGNVSSVLTDPNTLVGVKLGALGWPKYNYILVNSVNEASKFFNATHSDDTNGIYSFTSAAYTLYADPQENNPLFGRMVNVAANYLVSTLDYKIRVTNTSAPRTITLPPTSAIPLNTIFIIKDVSGGAGTNNITVQAQAPDQIDGNANVVINTTKGCASVSSTIGGYDLV